MPVHQADLSCSSLSLSSLQIHSFCFSSSSTSSSSPLLMRSSMCLSICCKNRCLPFLVVPLLFSLRSSLTPALFQTRILVTRAPVSLFQSLAPPDVSFLFCLFLILSFHSRPFLSFSPSLSLSLVNRLIHKKRTTNTYTHTTRHASLCGPGMASLSFTSLRVIP